MLWKDTQETVNSDCLTVDIAGSGVCALHFILFCIVCFFLLHVVLLILNETSNYTHTHTHPCENWVLTKRKFRKEEGEEETSQGAGAKGGFIHVF